MSNLKLPTMTYENLDALLGSSFRKEIAYATHAERVHELIYVKHHASVIAVLDPEVLYVTNAGYDTSTTYNRLRKILGDNKVPYTVRIKQYAGTLYQSNGERVGLFHAETFRRVRNAHAPYMTSWIRNR